jgi:lactoylglutathione lyase
MTTPSTTGPGRDGAQLGYVINWVKDIPAATTFYRDAFGFAVTREADMGAFQWVQFDTGATTLAFAGAAELEAMFPEGRSQHDPARPPLSAQISIVAGDIAPLWERALAHGATPIAPPAAMPWGQTWAQMRDPNGVLVSLATPMGA